MYLLALCVCAALGSACTAAPHGGHSLDLQLGHRGVRVSKPVHGYGDERFKGIVRQQYDFSCGAAALATLLKYYYDESVDEESVAREMLQRGDTEKIRRSGFSMLDLKAFAERRRYETRGFKLAPELLERLAIPAITLITTRGYSHFVVLKGVKNGTVYLADPALGQRRLPLEEFTAQWQGVVFFAARQRSSEVPSPLQALDLGLSAPLDQVRRIDSPGVARNHFFDPLEF